jgi:hypothetical protein
VNNLEAVLSRFVETNRTELRDFMEASRGIEIPFFSRHKLEFLSELGKEDSREFLDWVQQFNANESLEKEIHVLRSASINTETPNLIEDLEIIREKLRKIGLKEVGAQNLPGNFLQLLEGVEILQKHPNMLRQLAMRRLLLHHEIESARNGTLASSILIETSLQKIQCTINMPNGENEVQVKAISPIDLFHELSFHELENLEKKLVRISIVLPCCALLTHH